MSVFANQETTTSENLTKVLSLIKDTLLSDPNAKRLLKELINQDEKEGEESKEEVVLRKQSPVKDVEGWETKEIDFKKLEVEAERETRFDIEEENKKSQVKRLESEERAKDRAIWTLADVKVIAWYSIHRKMLDYVPNSFDQLKEEIKNSIISSWDVPVNEEDFSIFLSLWRREVKSWYTGGSWMSLQNGIESNPSLA